MVGIPCLLGTHEPTPHQCIGPQAGGFLRGKADVASPSLLPKTDTKGSRPCRDRDLSVEVNQLWPIE